MAANNTYQLDSGPLESFVLTEQLTHRSRDIWDGSVNMILNTRRRARAVERGQVPVEMDEAASEDDQTAGDIGIQVFSSLENVFGNYRPQHENAPNFISSHVLLSMEFPDAMTNLEDSNIEIKEMSY
ncbi:hypothetical protein RDI58_022177 [Solanum bulbocastanum]|uniref:Uncharacterized protein n=1 Tax=Solanum bulbocastanum TaxID=147425 RepID=A0AAN8T8V1_SOLBU